MEKFVVDVDGTQAMNPVPLQEYLQKNYPQLEDNPINVVFWVILGVSILVGIGFLSSLVFLVKQQTVKIIERFGKFVRVARAGLNFKIPLIERESGIVSLRIQEISEDVLAKSSDNAFVNIPVKTQFQIVPDRVMEAYYNLTDPEQQMSSYITNIVRSVASDMTMELIYQSKDKFEEHVKTSLNEKFSEFGYAILNVLVDNPLPSPEVVQSFNKVIASKRLKEAAENEAEALRIKEVAHAKAEAESLTLKAEAYVKQRQGMAEFFKGLEGDLATYLQGIDQREMMRDIARHGNLIMLPNGANGDLISSLIASTKKTPS